MKLLKIVLFNLLLALSFNANASVLKVFDVLIDSAGFDKLMTSRGILDRSVIFQARKNVRYSLQDISKGPEGTMKDLKALKNMINNSKDKGKYNKMMKTFSKDSKAVSREELIDSINNLVFLSQRYGLKNKSILACAPCVNKELAEAGFEFTLSELKDESSKRIFQAMNRRARDPKTAIKFINTEIRKQKLGSKVNVKAHEEEAFIYMLLIPKYGSAEQKRVFDAMKKVSKNSKGKTDFFDRSNGHKFYNIFSDNLSSSDLNLWEDLLGDTAKVMDDEGMGTMDAFYKVLERRADNSADEVEKEDLLAKLDFIKREGCFSAK